VWIGGETVKWTPEELEAMRLADEEIDREFERKYVADQTQKEIDAWLDELAVMDLMDRKSYHRRRKQKQYSAAYREAHKEEIAAKKAAYYEAHKEEIAAKKAAYREGQKGRVQGSQPRKVQRLYA